LLDRLGLHPKVFTREQYKSVFTFINNTKYPEPIRQNMESLVHSLHGQFVAGVAEGRLKWLTDADMYRIEENTVRNEGEPTTLSKEQAKGQSDTRLALEKVRRAFDLAPLSAQESLAAGLVTQIKYRREMTDFFSHELREPTIWGQVRKHKTVNSMSLQRYKIAKDMETGRNKKRLGRKLVQPAVGLVYLTGTISRGDGPHGSNTVIKALTDASRDPEVCAIVLRIDSGGGDAIASDSIWEGIRHVREWTGKPVFASFGNTTASGGYYAAAACDKIFAMRMFSLQRWANLTSGNNHGFDWCCVDATKAGSRVSGQGWSNY